MTQIPKARQDEIDSLYRNPKERAEDVNAIIQLASKELKMDFSLFDTTCFAIQWLSMLAIGEFAHDKEFVDIAIRANRWLHTIHYNAPEEIHGPPDKETKGGDA